MPLGHSAAGVPDDRPWSRRAEQAVGLYLTESGASERTTGFEPATLTLAR